MRPGGPAHVVAVALLVWIFLSTGWVLLIAYPFPVYPTSAERCAELLR